jgi:hypothetical protein
MNGTIAFTRHPDGSFTAGGFPESIDVAKDLPLLWNPDLARLFVVFAVRNGYAKYELRHKDDHTFVGTRIPDHPGACTICGCTELSACEGGCCWADDQLTLCSRCAALHGIEVEEDCGDCVHGLVDGMNNDPDQPVFCACPAGRARQAEFEARNP